MNYTQQLAVNKTILAWNVQGAGNRSFLATLKELIRRYSPTILLLVETKISGTTADEVCKKINFDGVFRVEAQGFSGGIWALWLKDEVHLQVISSSAQHATMEVSEKDLDCWILSAIYGSLDEQRRMKLWGDLDSFAQYTSHPWLLIGDFNDTRSMDERRNRSAHLTRRCAHFNNWIENNGLIDLGFSGPLFTWSCGLNPETRKYARLDRALCNQSWRMRFQEAGIRHLVQNQTDHCLLLVSLNGYTPMHHFQRPFRFQAAWTTHENFTPFLTQHWDTNTPLYPLLTRVSKALVEWNNSVFGNLFHRKNQVWARLEGTQK